MVKIFRDLRNNLIHFLAHAARFSTTQTGQLVDDLKRLMRMCFIQEVSLAGREFTQG